MEFIESLNQPAFWLYFVYTILVIMAVLHILYQRRSPQNLMAWLLTLLLLPFVGLLLYVVLGSRKFFTQRKKPIIALHSTSNEAPSNPLGRSINNILLTNHLPGATHNNQVQTCTSATEAFEILMLQIQSATSSIHIQTYILEADRIGNRILDALIKKSSEGVEVCLLLDAIGSFHLYRSQKKLKPLLNAGGQYAFFQPIFKSAFNSQVNLRNHRKIYLFDGKTLLTGGMNLSKDYMSDAGDQMNNESVHWKDLLFKIEGPAVFHYQNIFNEDWKYTTNLNAKRYEQLQPSIASQTNQGDTIQVIPSGPDIEKDVLFETLLHSIFAAKSRIDIVSPYFIPDSSLMNALLVAIKRGVNVSLTTPYKSDHFIFDLGRSSYMRELHENGGKVYLDKSVMLHAKMVIIDQDCVIMGSANLDYRSLFINHEVVNYIYSKEVMNEMQAWLKTLQNEAMIYHSSSKKRHRLLENLTRIFAPIL